MVCETRTFGVGFATNDDAFTVAGWMIKEYGNQKHFPPRVPLHVLHELKIKNQSTYHSPEN